MGACRTTSETAYYARVIAMNSRKANKKLNLIERRVAIAREVILLGVIIALTTTAVICALRSHWTSTAGLGAAIAVLARCYPPLSGL